MTTFGFTLIVEGIPTSDDGFIRFSNSVYEAAPDSTVSIDRVGFDREAKSLRKAVASAVVNLHHADPAVSVCGIILDDGQPIDQLFAPVAAVAAN